MRGFDLSWRSRNLPCPDLNKNRDRSIFVQFLFIFVRYIGRVLIRFAPNIQGRGNMPRIGRVVLPEYPHHIVQRGHDRNVVFASASDYQYYLRTLTEFKDVFGVRVYAYCLMTNHVHLLLSPSDHKGLGLLMKRLAGRQTRYRNKLEGRSGTLWESRYRSSVVKVEQYLLACVRYIELNPVELA